MSHPRQDDDRRLGDNEEAEATKEKAATPEDQNSNGSESTTSKN
jgi:hypothetical protein